MLAGLGLLATLGMAACNGPRIPQGKPYIPPEQTFSLQELIEQINSANARIQSLYLESEGGAGFEATLRESRDQTARFVNGDIVAIYLAPDKLRLKGKKAGAGDVFDLGSDGERFWLHLPTEKQLYTGTFEGLDPEAARELPVRPDLVLEVLGIAPLDSDLLRTPAPMLRFNPDSDVYMLTYAETVEGPPPRWVIVKEVWYDRQTLLPKLVVIFNDGGDPVLRAYLSQHQEISGGGPPIASRYDLYFPETGSNMWLSFQQLHPRNPRNRRFPNEGSFNPPDSGVVPNVDDLDQPRTPVDPA